MIHQATNKETNRPASWDSSYSPRNGRIGKSFHIIYLRALSHTLQTTIHLSSNHEIWLAFLNELCLQNDYGFFLVITNKILYYKTFQGEIQTGCDSVKCQGHEKQGKTEKRL